MRDDLLTVRAPCGRGEGWEAARPGEAAEPGVLPGADGEAFPGASLHPTDHGGSSDPHCLHTTLSGSTHQPSRSNTALCVCCQHKGFLGVPEQTSGLLLPRTSHPASSHHTPGRGAGGGGDVPVVLPSQLLPRVAALGAGVEGSSGRGKGGCVLSILGACYKVPFSSPRDNGESVHVMTEKTGLGQAEAGATSPPPPSTAEPPLLAFC